MYHAITVPDEKYKELNPVLFGYEDCAKAHAFGPAIRTYWLIHFVVSGFGYFQIGDKEYSIGPGEMFVIPPYVETYYKADDEKPWDYIWIGFTADGELPAKLAPSVFCPEAVKIFNAMKNCEQMTNGKSAFLCARLWDLFALLLGHETNSKDYIDMALDCIHSEYMNDLKIEDIAHRLNLDRTYFSALFKKKIGMSPKQYLLYYRMNTAISLMMDCGKSVSVAAYSVGFSSVYNFSKMFKAHYGQSPREYVSHKRNHA